MPITRAVLESRVISYCGPKLDKVGLDGVTRSGNNRSLDDVLATAVMEMGYEPADLGTVTDDDLAAVPVSQLPQMADRAKLAALRTIAGRFDRVDVSAGGDSFSLNQFVDQVMDSIDDLQKTIARDYGTRGSRMGIAVGRMTSGGDRGAGGLIAGTTIPTDDWSGRVR